MRDTGISLASTSGEMNKLFDADDGGLRSMKKHEVSPFSSLCISVKELAVAFILILNVAKGKVSGQLNA